MATGTMTQVPSLPGSSRNSIFFDSVFREAQGRSVGNYSDTDKGRTETPGASARQMTTQSLILVWQMARASGSIRCTSTIHSLA